MKKIILILFLLLVITEIRSQTNVSGGIFSNTTWSLANSPYIVTGNIVLFPGLTLTIQSGVVVKFKSNVYIEIRQSTLLAIGTSTNQITFTRDSLSLAWDQIYLNGSPLSKFDNCNFMYANNAINGGGNSITIKNSSFSNNNYGINNTNGAYIIDSCNFINNAYGVYWTGGSYIRNSRFTKNQTGFISYTASNLSRCIIDSNTVVGVFKESGDNDTISYNEIKNNATGYSTGGGGGGGFTYIHNNIISNNNIGIHIVNAGVHQDSLYCNSICYNSTYNVKYELPANVSFANNNWCGIDSSQMEQLIYDGHDDISNGLVVFTPIDNSNCSPFVNIDPFVNSYSQFNLFPNPTGHQFFVDANTTGKLSIDLFNVNGRHIFTKYVNNKSTIDVSDLTEGIYTLKIKTENGFTNKKLVIAR